MPDKDIFCAACNIYLGVLRDAKLKKGIVFLCKDCFDVPEETPIQEPSSRYDHDDTVEYIRGLFGMRENPRRSPYGF